MDTAISVTKGRVVYDMEPYVADELAAILQRAATRNKSPNWDRGWLQDATSLIEASNVITTPLGDTLPTRPVSGEPGSVVHALLAATPSGTCRFWLGKGPCPKCGQVPQGDTK